MREDWNAEKKAGEKQEEEEEQVTLLSLLLQSQNKGIQTSDQYGGRYPDREDNPSVAPGWNALMVQDVVAGMFMMTAVERNGAGTEGNPPQLDGGELESAVPGLPDRVRTAIAGHLISDRLRRALDEEVRDTACQLVRDMTSEERDSLIRACQDRLGKGPGETGTREGETPPFDRAQPLLTWPNAGSVMDDVLESVSVLAMETLEGGNLMDDLERIIPGTREALEAAPDLPEAISKAMGEKEATAVPGRTTAFFGELQRECSERALELLPEEQTERIRTIARARAQQIGEERERWLNPK